MRNDSKVIFNISPVLWTMGKDSGMPSIYEVQKGFVKAGHKVHFITSDMASTAPLHEEITEEGIHIHPFSLPRVFHKIWGLLKLLAVRAERFWRLIYLLYYVLTVPLLYSLFVFLALRKAIIVKSRTKPDIIYGHFPMGIIAAYIFSRLYKIPNVSRFYGFFNYEAAVQLSKLRWVIPELMCLRLPANLVIVTNDGTFGDRVTQLFKIPQEKVRFWMNGVDKNMYDPNFNKSQFKKEEGVPQDSLVILTVSRLDYWKRVDRIIRALPKIIAENPNTICLIVGDGPARKGLEELSKQLCVQNNIRFVGSIKHDMVKKYMNGADLFMSLYDFSNLGNPLLEAMVCGKCIVTLDAGGVNEVVKNGDNGILLRYDQLAELASCANSLFEDASLREHLGNRAREYAMANFATWEERAAKEVQEVVSLFL